MLFLIGALSGNHLPIRPGIFLKKDDLAFISGKTKSKHGLEFKIGSKSVTMKIVKMLQKKYGGEIKLSRKLVSRKKGRDLYRLTVSLRIQKI